MTPMLIGGLSGLVLLAGTAAWGAWERSEAIRHAAAAEAASKVLEQTQGTVTALQQAAAQQAEAVTALARAAELRTQQSNAIRRNIYAAPQTSSCLGSPASIAFLRGVRATAAGSAPSGAPDTAGSAAAVPGGATGASRAQR